MQPIPEWRDVDERTLREEILTGYRPAVLRGLVKDWPAVQAAQVAPANLTRYLAAFDNDNPVDAILMPPDAGGRIAYNEAMDGFNFVRNRLPVSAILEQLARYARFENPPAVAVQSALISNSLPGFVAENRLPVLDPAIEPRIWIGNRVTVPAHFDESQNLACVVAGVRRFTVFPPEQVANLYVGPLDFAPTGAAMSMVPFAAPDFRKFPRLRDALASSQRRRARPRRCHLHTHALVAPRGVAGHEAQRTRQLLVERRAWRGREDGLGNGLPASMAC